MPLDMPPPWGDGSAEFSSVELSHVWGESLLYTEHILSSALRRSLKQPTYPQSTNGGGREDEKQPLPQIWVNRLGTAGQPAYWSMLQTAGMLCHSHPSECIK